MIRIESKYENGDVLTVKMVSIEGPIQLISADLPLEACDWDNGKILKEAAKVWYQKYLSALFTDASMKLMDAQQEEIAKMFESIKEKTALLDTSLEKAQKIEDTDNLIQSIQQAVSKTDEVVTYMRKSIGEFAIAIFGIEDKVFELAKHVGYEFAEEGAEDDGQD